MATKIETCGFCEKPVDPNDIENTVEAFDANGNGLGEYCHLWCVERANETDFIYRPPCDEPMKAPLAV